MKVINIIENLDDTYGGPAKSVPYMCKYLGDIGVNTQIVSIKCVDNEKNTLVKKHNLTWSSFNYKGVRKFRYSSEMKIFLESLFIKNNDIILHTQNLWNYISYVSFRIHNKYDAPLVVSIRGSLYKWSLKQSKLKKRIAWMLFQKKVLQNCSCIHVTEKKELEAVRSLKIKTPIAIIPNGINLEEFNTSRTQQKAKCNLGLKYNKKYILFISRLHPKKGIEFLVNSWVSLNDQYNEWDLLIVGPEEDKSYVNSLKSNINKNELTDRVVFTGMLEGQQRLDAFAASSLFVLPSHTENFGVAIAEAMAAKLPVITTHGTPWEEIDTYGAGWWVELCQENINQALGEALSCSGEDLKQKGLNGYQLIKKYEWKYQAKKMEELYIYLLNKGIKPKFIYENSDKI
jgi:glycosyltransferase involved in cell wall biosynthesis